MKPYLTFVLIAMVFLGCSKSGDVKPVASNSSTVKKPVPADSVAHSTNTGLSHDDSIHVVTFSAAAQKVNVSVSGKSLFMVFDENVDLYFSAEGFQKTSAVHLKEDFGNTSLKDFDFTTVAEQGNVTLNWVDDNLNNVILKTVTDTVINGQKMVKINVHRAFTFFKVYESAQEAIDEQTNLLEKSDEKITFSSYCYYNQKNYTPYLATAKVVYSK
jgi:hypothetical protein